MSLYARLEKQDPALKQYVNASKHLFSSLIRAVPGSHNVLLQPSATEGKPLLCIVVGTSKGLCGSLNSNLFRFLDASLSENNQGIDFVVIGSKATKYIAEKQLGTVICTYAELASNNFITIADDLISKIKAGDSAYSSVIVFSNHAKSFFTQKPCKTVVVPFEHGILDLTEEVAENQGQMIWEQGSNEVLEQLAMQYLRGSIMNLLFQSLRAEHAARFLAMENSTSNAEKYLEKLTLQYNKQRQSLITREVSELCAAFPTR